LLIRYLQDENNKNRIFYKTDRRNTMFSLSTARVFLDVEPSEKLHDDEQAFFESQAVTETPTTDDESFLDKIASWNLTHLHRTVEEMKTPADTHAATEKSTKIA
jgi:hypothetical protein